jgi:CheY-like chemotaxis protein
MTTVVLIVDDNERLRGMLAQILHSRGYETVEAATGSEAVTKTSSTRPDLIVMDFDLPDMTGADAARIIKNDPRTQKIPIIGCSALSGSEFRHAALEAGMVEYLIKPLSEERITAKIAQFIISER